MEFEKIKEITAGILNISPESQIRRRIIREERNGI